MPGWESMSFEQENFTPNYRPQSTGPHYRPQSTGPNGLPGFYESAAATHPPFQFHAHRSRIDWRVLHGIDVDEVVRPSHFVFRGGVSFKCSEEACLGWASQQGLSQK